MPAKPTALAALALIGVLGLAGPASAHVTASSTDAAQGSFGKVTFRMPNERDDSGSVKLEVFLPEDQPIAFVSVKPKPGWQAALERTTLDQPIEVFGEEVTEAVSKVTWEGGEVAPGQFDEFEISVGPLPEVDALHFKAIQTYASGEVVRWIEETPEGGEEPEHPAPVLELKASGEGGHTDSGETDEPAEEEPATQPLAADLASQDDVDSATTLSIVALVIGAIGLLVGIGGLLRGRAQRSA